VIQDNCSKVISADGYAPVATSGALAGVLKCLGHQKLLFSSANAFVKARRGDDSYTPDRSRAVAQSKSLISASMLHLKSNAALIDLRDGIF
jgi:hypothetical protein